MSRAVMVFCTPRTHAEVNQLVSLVNGNLSSTAKAKGLLNRLVCIHKYCISPKVECTVDITTNGAWDTVPVNTVSSYIQKWELTNG